MNTSGTVDLNSDLGEGHGSWSMGDDDALLSIVTSANVACGFHAGDPSIMRHVTMQAVTNGVAIGYAANGAYTNIAIGVAADAQLGTERIAIGHNVTNDVDHSARIRGDFYMDGGDRVFGRHPFATGAFQQLLPLPPLENVVYVASNGTFNGSGAIDRPFDTPQNGYDFAAGKYTNEPATLVIASGNDNANVSAYSPGNCANVISVAANDRQGNRAWYSNYGSLIDVTAPGHLAVTETAVFHSVRVAGHVQVGADSTARYHLQRNPTPIVLAGGRLQLADGATLRTVSRGVRSQSSNSCSCAK